MEVPTRAELGRACRPFWRVNRFGDILGKGGDSIWKQVLCKHIHCEKEQNAEFLVGGLVVLPSVVC